MRRGGEESEKKRRDQGKRRIASGDNVVAGADEEAMMTTAKMIKGKPASVPRVKVEAKARTFALKAPAQTTWMRNGSLNPSLRRLFLYPTTQSTDLQTLRPPPISGTKATRPTLMKRLAHSQFRDSTQVKGSTKGLMVVHSFVGKVVPWRLSCRMERSRVFLVVVKLG